MPGEQTINSPRPRRKMGLVVVLLPISNFCLCEEHYSGSVSNLTGVKDLTGKVEKQDRYAFAHGGFSDIWKGTLLEGERSRNVAVKVLRSKIDDKELEEKMIRRLRRELSIWKNLNHPNILSLLGTASDFGHYTSMVCPWMENGSVSKYLERCGDIMSPTDRLKLSNILITDDGKACLCDFGLSTIAAEFHGTSYLTSTIGGAVRWADALFYRVRQEEEQQAPLAITIRSDIYSFGSVMLEVVLYYD
ncbi:hypothetical protein H0H93_006565 [Arthromyces matolae]|nr:hypothetical protein H0H93_006565 [Arthromyces matolae]